MRLRNISGARDAIAESPLVIHEPEKLKGKWRERFGNNRPIRIEIGMGKGKFIHELAEKNPFFSASSWINFPFPIPISRDRNGKRKIYP